MRKYFIHNGEKEKGPFTLEELKNEKMSLATPIWYQGLDQWTTAGDVEEIKSMIGTPPPLINTPPPIYHYEENMPPSDASTNKKRNLMIVAACSIAVIFISWLIYQNSTQAEKIASVQSKLTEQEQKLNDKDQQEQQRLMDEKQKETEKVKIAQQQETQKKAVNEKVTKEFMGYGNNWRTYFMADHNNYTYSELGGITNLQVIAYNVSNKMVDEIQVKVDYKKANGGNYKTEYVTVTNIGPKASKTVSAPSSDRGTSVNMEIVSITARAIHFCYPDGMSGNQDFDPYFCK